MTGNVIWTDIKTYRTYSEKTMSSPLRIIGMNTEEKKLEIALAVMSMTDIKLKSAR